MDAAARFFGVSFRNEPGAAVWDPGVEVWDVLENGSIIGRVYLDLYTRPGKFGGAGNAETPPVVRAKHPTHTHLAQTLRWIARVKPKRAILTHMDVQLDYETLRRELPAGVEPGYDGLVIDL